MVVQLVMFKSGLSAEDVRRTIEDRAPQYRALPGLVQKLYVRNGETGEYGGLYVWKDAESLEEFRQSQLSRTIPEAYKVEGQPRRETAEVVYVLREDVRFELAA
jgi:Putative mono-oxygenase ydhR